MRSIRRRILALTLTLACLWVLSTGAATWALTRRARPVFPEPAPQDMAELHTFTGDGLQVGAWLCEGPPQAPMVLLLHGNRSCRSNEVGLMRWVAQHQVTVLAPSLRCHGDSSGTVNDFGYRASLDVEAWVEVLSRRYPGRRCLIFGRSLGASAALFASPRCGPRVQGYLLESPFFDLPSAVDHRLQSRLGPLHALALQSMTWWARAFLPEPAEAIAPGRAAAAMPPGMRVTVMAGERDYRAPVQDARAIVERIPGARLVVFPGADHGGLQQTDPAAYEAELSRLMNR